MLHRGRRCDWSRPRRDDVRAPSSWVTGASTRPSHTSSVQTPHIGDSGDSARSTPSPSSPRSAGRRPCARRSAPAERSLARQPDSPRLAAYLLVYLGVLRALSGDVGRRPRELRPRASRTSRSSARSSGSAPRRLSWLGDTDAVAGGLVPRARGAFDAGPGLHARPARASGLARLLPRTARRGCARASRSYTSRSASRSEAAAVAVAGDVETNVWWRRVAARALVRDRPSSQGRSARP